MRLRYADRQPQGLDGGSARMSDTYPAKAVRAPKLARVPIKAIMEAEFRALGTRQHERERIKGRYLGWVLEITGKVSEHLGFGRTVGTRRKALAEAVNGLDEKVLFGIVSGASDVNMESTRGSMLRSLIRKALAGEDSTALLAGAVKENDFRCYPSTVLVADALTRLGKPVRIIYTEDHVFLAGERYVFDVSVSGYTARLEGAIRNFPVRQETTADCLAGLTHYQIGMMAHRAGRAEAALASYGKSIDIIPESGDSWFGKGKALLMLGPMFEEEALSAFVRASVLSPKNANVWHSMGVVLSNIGRNEEAISALDQATIADPGFAKANPSMALILKRAGRK